MAVILRLICLLFASAAAFGASTNDYFTNRIVLFGTLPSGTGNLTGATVEPGEPHPYNSSLWWEWTPNYEGGISVSTVGNSIYPAVLVYSGEWPNLTLVSSPRPSSLFIQPTPVSFYALSNTTYYLAVAANTNFTTGAVAIRTGSAPAADSFSRANPIIGTNVSSTQSLRGTTIEPGEISSSTNVVGTLWHRWTNIFASRYVIQGVSSSGPLNLAVYSGDSVTNLTRLAFAENTSILGGARVVLDLEPATYYIAIEDLGFQSTATFSIRLVPHNDDFADRAVLPSDPDVFSSVPFLGATREAGEPGSTNGSVWWEWTAPATGSYSVESISSVLATGVEVYRGDQLTNLVLLTPPLTNWLRNVASVRATAGETYVIRVVADYTSNGTVPIRIRPGPENDDFANAIFLHGSVVTTNSSILGATFEVGEPRPNSGAGSVWYIWNPTNSGAYSIEARISGGTIPLYAFRGNSLTNLTSITNAYTGNVPYAAPSTILVEAGETIYFQIVHEFDTAALVFTIQPGSANDNFSNAILITNEVSSGTTRGASFEQGEPWGGARGQTVWYRWQPSNSGGYDIQLAFQSGEGNVLTLYEGDALTNLTLIRRISNPPPEQFSATILPDVSGTYYIAVDGQTPGGTTFNFRIASGPTNDSFANRTAITALDEPIAGVSFGATREPGEPQHLSSNADRTVWFEWTAPTTGGFYVEAWAPTVPPEFAFYQGTVLTNLTSVRSYDQLSAGPSSYTRFTSFRAVQGEKYLIVMLDRESRGVQFHIRKGPFHDEFANALELPFDVSTDQLSMGATVQPGEPGEPIPTGTIWHYFIAPSNSTYVAIAYGGLPKVYRGTEITNLVPAEVTSTNVLPYAYTFRAAGTEKVFVAITAGFPSSYNLRIAPGAENDDFANRLSITNTSTVAHGAFSSMEPGEPAYSTNFSGGSLWWKWTPTNSGIHRIQGLLGHRAAFLGVYSGTNLADLSLIVGSETANSDIPWVQFRAEAGVEYSILLAHVPYGDNPVGLEIHTPAINDEFSAATSIPFGETASTSFNFATRDDDPLAHPLLETIWYQWTAPTNDTFVVVPTVSIGAVQGIEIFIGSELTNLTLVTSVAQPMLNTAAAFRAVEGTIYRIRLTFDFWSEARTVQVVVSPGNPHDDIAEAAQLSGLFTGWTNTTFGTTMESGEELLQSSFPNSAWATWTAPESGPFRVISNPTRNNGISSAVYRGDSLENLQLVGTLQNYGVSLDAEAGATYFVRVASMMADAQSFRIRIGPVVTNDSPASSVVLEGTNVTVTGQNWTAVTPLFNPSSTIWYSWTAPSHGLLTYITSTNGTPTVFAFHTRKPTLESNLVSANPIFPTIRRYTNTIAVTGGIDYLFSIGGQPTTNLTFQLDFEEDPVSLSTYTNALLGGDDLWFAQSEVAFSGPDALQAGPFDTNREAWIEMVFVGPGTLRYRTRLEGPSGIIEARTQSNIFPPFPVTQLPHDWTLRTLNLPLGTNVVRWIFTVRSTRTRPLATAAWLDDIEFIPAAPRQPRLSMFIPTGDSPLLLSIQLEANRNTTVDVSTNLTEWLPFTNLFSNFSLSKTIQLAPSTNEVPQFFRARVTP